MYITEGLVEQHIHGAFGCDFMKCEIKELLETANNLAEYGVTAFFPTVMTDDINVIKDRIKIIQEAAKLQKSNTAQIAGIHLEGPFINPEKSGIHDKKYILPLDINLYKEIEDTFIKIVTIAPELDIKGDFVNYLIKSGVKVSAGHTKTNDLSKVNQVTHLYNAMTNFHHRDKNTVTEALINDIYTEIIADSMHVSDEVLKLTFKIKPIEKILLISDALPLAHSNKTEQMFAGQNIYNKNGKLVNKDGVFAGSSMFISDMIKNLADKNILKFTDAIKIASANQLNYHKLNNKLKIFWNESNKISKIEFI